MSRNITRRQLLKAAAIGTPLAGLGLKAALSAKGRKPIGGIQKNVIIFMTDQERAIQHFPANWEKENLPGLTALKRHGLSFENAFTNACMCSPARSTFMSGYFPAQHGVKYTLEESMQGQPNLYPQFPLPTTLPNLASVMLASDYNVIYKGKWHCSLASEPSDLQAYGFSRWNPQDAGANQSISQGGGPPQADWTTQTANNDGRYMYDDGSVPDGDEGVLDFIYNEAWNLQPFFLVISLVNPHDVLFFPSSFQASGYSNDFLNGTIGIPETINEDLSTKPTAQRQFRDFTVAGLGPLPTDDLKRAYLNFYGNLMKLSDGHLVEVLQALELVDLLDDTLIIRTADHGEMGLTHGGQRQKNFNFYEESLRVPLVYSNPQMFPGSHQTKALVSHVDFLPTLASLVDAPSSARADWQGIDYSGLIVDPSAHPVQDYTVFTYDDFQSGQPLPAQGPPPYPTPPQHIVSIREERYKLAEYYDVRNGPEHVPSQFEMYDLDVDPLERTNLANPNYHRNPAQQREYERLLAKLAQVKATRLQAPG
jgi:arylsulfatase A-like enzyme